MRSNNAELSLAPGLILTSLRNVVLRGHWDSHPQVLRTINRSSKRTQVDSRKKRKEAEEEETIVEVDSTKDERQKLLDQRKAEREAMLEEKRQKKLDAREARRKEVEAKKQKALEKRANGKSSKTSTRYNLSLIPKTEAMPKDIMMH